MDEDIGILKINAHFFLVCDEVWGEVTPVELHALDDFEFGVGRFGFLDGDDAFMPDLSHGIGQILSDLRITIGRNGADLGDFGIVRDLAGVALQFLDNCSNCKVDTALQIHRVHAGRFGLGAFTDYRLGEHCRRRRAISGNIAGSRCDLAQHLRTHILELVLKFDFLGDRYAVLGDAWRAIGLLYDDVAALGA